jgi:hypothetical protein
VYHAQPDPGLVHTDGGVLLAHLGTSSDDGDAEFDDLLGKVADALARVRRTVLVSNHRGPLSNLFAPADLPVITMPAVIAWVFHLDSVDAWVGRFETLVGRMRAPLSAAPGQTLSLAYFVDSASVRTLELGLLLKRARFAPRHTEPDGAVLLEVHRPEGVVLSAFRGASAEAPVQVSPETIGGPPERLKRAPRLRRQALAALEERSDASWRALMVELLGRPWHVLLIANSAGEVRPYQWPGSKLALSAYADEQAFGWAVEDMNLGGDVVMAGMSPRSLFAWADQIGTGVALNVYRDRGSPVYLQIGGSQVAALARGELPPRVPQSG